MQNSSVLIVHPSDHRFRLPDMANGKFAAGRHFSLDSPGSLTSPPGYEQILDHKPTTLASFSMPTTCSQNLSSASQPFGQLNPHHLVYPTAHTAGLLPLSKWPLRKSTAIIVANTTYHAECIFLNSTCCILKRVCINSTCLAVVVDC